MPINLPAAWATLRVLFKPECIIPSLAVRDIRYLNFSALHQAGYRGVIFDKDNCMTNPYSDELIPELKEAWNQCKDTFGKDNVVIVSNSAGTSHDPGYLAAESVSHHLEVPVLRHTSPKPSYRCIQTIRSYFSSRPIPVETRNLVVVGDRLLTDIIMANAKDMKSLSVWTTHVWQKESTLIRIVERSLLKIVESHMRGEVVQKSDAKEGLVSRFVRDDVVG